MTEPRDPGEARIEAALSRLGAEHEPPPGWEARVLAAIGPERRRRPWWVFAAPGLAVAVSAAIVVLVVLPPKPKPLAIALSSPPRDPHEPPRVTRGDKDEHQIGETIRATVSGGAPHRALWVYRDERDLVVACPPDLGCEISSDAIFVDFVLEIVGEYKIIALSSSAAVPAPSGNYDADMAAATRPSIERHDDKFHVQ